MTARTSLTILAAAVLIFGAASPVGALLASGPSVLQRDALDRPLLDELARLRSHDAGRWKTIQRELEQRDDAMRTSMLEAIEELRFEMRRENAGKIAAMERRFDEEIARLGAQVRLLVFGLAFAIAWMTVVWYRLWKLDRDVIKAPRPRFDRGDAIRRLRAVAETPEA